MKQLPVIAIIKETFLLVWKGRFALFRALIVTGLAMTALDVALTESLKGPEESSTMLAPVLLYLLLGWGLFVLFATTCHRIVLLGEASVPKYGLLSWTRRETRFFGWGIVSGFYFLLFMVPIMLASFAISFEDEDTAKFWIFTLSTVGWVPATYVVARLAVLFPATAIGERRNTGWAFATTAKSGWRLVAATMLVTAPFALGAYLLPVEDSLSATVIAQIVGYAFAAIGIVALSLSFRFLTSGSLEESAESLSLREYS